MGQTDEFAASLLIVLQAADNIMTAVFSSV